MRLGSILIASGLCAPQSHFPPCRRGVPFEACGGQGGLLPCRALFHGSGLLDGLEPLEQAA